MSKLLLAALIGLLAIAVSQPAGALNTEPEYKAAKEQADANYNVARQKCNSMSGNAKDVCVAEARGEQKKAKAQAEVAYRRDEKSRYNARIAAAEADYEVAKEKCDARIGEAKDLCLKQAKAAETKAKASAKANRS